MTHTPQQLCDQLLDVEARIAEIDRLISDATSRRATLLEEQARVAGQLIDGLAIGRAHAAGIGEVLAQDDAEVEALALEAAG